MLALDRGGSCRGVAYRIAAPGVREKVTAVWKREMTGNGYVPRWVKLTTMQGQVRGLTFVATAAACTLITGSGLRSARSRAGR